MSVHQPSGSASRRAFALVVLFAVVAGIIPADASADAYEKTFEVSESPLLRIDNRSGSVFVRGWDKNEIRVRARYRGDVEIVARTRPNRVSMYEEFHDEKEEVDYQIDAPVGCELQIRGHHTDLTVDGVYARIELETVDGDIFLLGGRDDIYARSLQGEVEIEGAVGHIEAHALNENVSVIDCEGSLLVETVDGNVRLQGLNTHEVDVSTVNGDVLYDSEIVEGGEYFFSTHDGNVLIRVDPDANVNVTVSNFKGTFDPDFPVDVDTSSDSRRIRFQMGNGGADLQIQSFSGDVRLFDPKRGRRKLNR